jgi:hypothetical protein
MERSVLEAVGVAIPFPPFVNPVVDTPRTGMAASPVTYGTAHLYGIAGTLTGVTVADFKYKVKPANYQQCMDENGNVIERRYDDNTTEATITVILTSTSTTPTAGSELTYNSVKYIIQDVEHSEQAKGARRETYNLITSQYITLP